MIGSGGERRRAVLFLGLAFTRFVAFVAIFELVGYIVHILRISLLLGGPF